jgi:hypothetical protein
MSHPYVISVTSHHFAPSPELDNSKKLAKLLHIDVRLLLLTPDKTIPLLQVEEPSATMDRSGSVDPDMLKKVIKTLLNMPDMKVPQAILLARFSNEEVADRSLHRFIQQSLPGKTLKGLKAHVSGPLPPPPPQLDCGEQLCNCAINDKAVHIEEGSHAAGVGACERAIPVTLSPLPPLPLAFARLQGWPP